MGTKKTTLRTSVAKRFADIEQISITSVTERMGPLALHMYADAYLDAARRLPPPSVPFEPVRPFLVCHCIELGLKAFLSLQGSTMSDLADASYGHNLEAILQKADEKQLKRSVALNDQHRAEIRRASVYYGGKLFEYPPSAKLSPGIHGCQSLIRCLRLRPCSSTRFVSDARRRSDGASRSQA
jgi:hypothetical protein